MASVLAAHDQPIRPAPQDGPQRAAPAGLIFRHVLVPLDGSPLAERSLPYVLAVARAGTARLTLLQVLQQPATGVGSRVGAVEWEMIRVEGQSYLAAIAGRLRAHGVESHIELVQGATAEQIETFAARGAVDLVVMTSHGEGGVSSNWARGSTAQKVIATARTSILVVPTPAGAGPMEDEVRLRRMLLPLDCSRRAEFILPAAIALARRHDAELILAHVVLEPEMPRRMGPSREDVELAQNVVERNRREAARYLREIQSRLASDSSRIQIRLCVGSKRAQALHELAQRERVDLVILAAHGSTGDAHQRYGGLAAKFLQEGYGPAIILQDFTGLGAPAERWSDAAAPELPHG
jgi:nucleotide-binding universal stress UspA family protein